MTVDTPALWIWGKPEWKVTWLLTPGAVMVSAASMVT